MAACCCDPPHPVRRRLRPIKADRHDRPPPLATGICPANISHAFCFVFFFDWVICTISNLNFFQFLDSGDKRGRFRDGTKASNMMAGRFVCSVFLYSKPKSIPNISRKIRETERNVPAFSFRYTHTDTQTHAR